MSNKLPRAELVATLSSAVLWALCFRRQPDPVLVWLALVPASLVILAWQRGVRRAFALGWLHGTLAWLIQIPWIATTIETYGGLPLIASWALWLLLALYLGLYHALWFASCRLLLRRYGSLPALSRHWLLAPGVMAALWVLLEQARGVALSGFPWNLAAYGAVSTPGALDVTRFAGTYGLSFLVVAVNASVALSVAPWWLRSKEAPSAPPKLQRLAIRRLAIPGLVVLVLGAALVSARPGSRVALTDAQDSPSEGPDEERLEITILQPNSGILDSQDPSAPLRAYQQVLSQLDGFCRAPVGGVAMRLAIAPESAFYPYSWQSSAVMRRDLIERLGPGCGLLLNSAFWQDEQTVYNTALLIDQQGVVARYLKNHLVPYGEYVPMEDLLPFLETVARQVGGFSAGSEITLLPFAGERFGVSICFEIVFPGEVAARARLGASSFVTITNDAWYGDSWAPWQHLRAARFRAAENRRPVLRAALTGVSAAIDERGRVVESLGVDQRGTIVVSLGQLTDQRLTLHSRLPWLALAASAALVVLAIGFVGRRSRSG